MHGFANRMALMLGALAMSAGALAVDAGAQDAADVTQPEGWALPEGDRAALVARGAALFDDPSIGESGAACTTCTTCHTDFENYNDTFLQPYPHGVAMGQNMFAMDEVTAVEMVQLCMVVPMATEPYAWDSDDLAALTAYVEDEQERFIAR